MVCTLFLGKQPVFSVTSDSIVKKIEVAIRSGSSKNLSSFFYKSIRLKIIGNNNIYSKKQAEMIIYDFFHENLPDSYKVNSYKINGKFRSVIGLYKSKKKSFRFHYRLTEYNGKLQIGYFEIDVADS